MIESIFFVIMLIFILCGLFLLVKFKTLKDEVTIKPKKGDDFAIIIPARDESKVIEGLLESIMKQTINVNPDDIYIVVEEKEDKTCLIAEKYKMNVVFRKDLTLRRKGYAIDDALKYIKNKKKHYDLYFIFDADNILDKDFIRNMLKSYKEGYDIAVGYRNTKNGNDSPVAAASSLTFTMINTMFNKAKLKRGLNITVSGTGFYISGDIVDRLGGYPFNMLTEDYELSVYSSLNNLSSTYREDAIFYDEQPTKYKTTVRQRTRWIRGYIDTRKKYGQALREKRKEKNNPKRGSIEVEYIGIKPYLLMVIGIVLYLLINVFMLIKNIIVGKNFCYNILSIVILFLFVYLVLAFITFIMIKKEKEYFSLSLKMKFLAILYNPIFLMGYVPIAIEALLNPNIEWSKIEHNKKV